MSTWGHTKTYNAIVVYGTDPHTGIRGWTSSSPSCLPVAVGGNQYGRTGLVEEWMVKPDIVPVSVHFL